VVGDPCSACSDDRDNKKKHNVRLFDKRGDLLRTIHVFNGDSIADHFSKYPSDRPRPHGLYTFYKMDGVWYPADGQGPAVTMDKDIVCCYETSDSE
jgi:hypothetical protein